MRSFSNAQKCSAFVKRTLKVENISNNWVRTRYNPSGTMLVMIGLPEESSDATFVKLSTVLDSHGFSKIQSTGFGASCIAGLE